MAARTLFLLRHASPESHAISDAARELTPVGVEQCSEVREFLAQQGVRIDRILCSPAMRTRQTAENLQLDIPITLAPDLYHASALTIRELAGTVDPQARGILVVGHAPGVPALVDDLADLHGAPDELKRKLEWGFPTATCARLDFDGQWLDLVDPRPAATLTAVHLAGVLR